MGVMDEWSTGVMGYDPLDNIPYIRFSEKTGEVDTIKISDEVNIDLDSDETIYRIELLNAYEQIRKEDMGKLLVNEATGEKSELSFGGK